LKFRELANPENSVWLFHTPEGLVAYRDITPKSVMELFEKINQEYRETIDRDFINILEKSPV